MHLTVAYIPFSIARGRARVSLESAPVNDPEAQEKKKQAAVLEDQIKALVAQVLYANSRWLVSHVYNMVVQMEELGEEGKVDESQALLKLVDELRTQKAQLEVLLSIGLLIGLSIGVC